MNALTTHTRSAAAGVAEWTAFLTPLVASVRNPPDRDGFRMKVGAMVTAFPDVPADLLAKQWLQAKAMRKFQFWPAVADVAELLAPELADTRQRAAAEAERLRLAPPPPKAERTAAEVAAVKAKLAAFKAEPRSAAIPVDPERKAKALFASPHQLLAGYEKDAAAGNAAARTRAAQLRKALGL